MCSEYPVAQDMRCASGINKELMKTTKSLQIPIILFGNLEKFIVLGSISMQV